MALYYNPKALRGARDSGFKSTTFALAEIIDNSFDANAKNVRVIFLEQADNNNQKYVAEIIICDDGDGMSDSILQTCLQFGGTENNDIDEVVAKSKRGKFGYGLPNSSLSQCPTTHVYSWQEAGNIRKATLDLPKIEASESIEIPDIETCKLPVHIEQIGATIHNQHGTIVCWLGCDRLSHKRAATIIKHAESHLGRLFRHLLADGKKITLENYAYNQSQGTYSKEVTCKVRCNDPLFLTENCVIASILKEEADGNANDKIRDSLSPFVVDDSKCLPTNIKLNDQSFEWKFRWRGKEYPIRFTTSVANKAIQKPGVREGGNTKVGRFYGSKMDTGSISFIRSQREISSGRYGIYKNTEARHRWWTIEVAFTPDADELFGVTNNKQDIMYWKTTDAEIGSEFQEWDASLQEARIELWIQLTKRLMAIQKEAFKIVKKTDKDWDTVNPLDDQDTTESGPPTETTSTTAALVTTDGKRPRQFSDEEREALANNLQERYPQLSKDSIDLAVDRFDQNLVRGVLLYSPSEADFLWSLTSVAGFLVILVNTEHEFYTNIMQPFREKGFESALSGLELFISSLAWDEYEHFWGNDNHRNTLEEYRSYVGLHLKRYLRENSIMIGADEIAATGSNSEELDD